MVRILSQEEVEKFSKEGAVILDTRPQSAYTQGHIPGVLFLSFGRTFSLHAPRVLPEGKKIVLVAPNAVNEIVDTLAQMGYQVLGYIESWKGEMLKSQEVDAETLSSNSTYHVVDVRTLEEWQTGHIQGAKHIPLSDFRSQLSYFKIPAKDFVLVCGTGYRSLLACSILEAQGIKAANLTGGMNAWNQEGLLLVRA